MASVRAAASRSPRGRQATLLAGAGGTGAVPAAGGSAGPGAARGSSAAGTGQRHLVEVAVSSEGGKPKRAKVPAGTTLFHAASWLGIAVDSSCGGHGTCRKCRVQVVSGAAAPSDADGAALREDALAAGWRLACRTPALGDVAFVVPPLRTRPKAALAGVGRRILVQPAVQKRYLELEPPSLEDQRADLDRLLDALDDVQPRVPLAVVRRLGGRARASDWRVTAVLCDDLLIDVEEGDTTARRFALAVDLGTTTVVATLLDLGTGQPVATASALNGQAPYGADVISRISALDDDRTALAALRRRVHETLAQLAGEVTAEGGVASREVYEVSVVGNVTMVELALGIDPTPLSRAPFPIAARRLPEARAADFGIPAHPQAPAILLPAPGAYVGSDTVAGALASGIALGAEPRLLIDIGTNTEIVVGSSRRLLACAAPAGPAFEGSHVTFGMRAADGAIEGVRIVGGEVRLDVIGGGTPAGLCGSGLIDAVAALLDAGVLDAHGRFVDVDGPLGERLTWHGAARAFALHDHVLLTQLDVRQLQLAKASIAAGWSVLCADLGIEPAQLTSVILAGSFGTYVSTRSARRIGLVPPVPDDRIVFAGNAASEGAKIVLLSLPERAAGQAILAAFEYVELSTRPELDEVFLAQLDLDR